MERPRLTRAILDTPPSGTCVLVSPPGRGATTAVVHALAATQEVAWVSLDGLDASPAHFRVQLTSALAPLMGSAARNDARVESDETAHIADIVESLEHARCAWLVLDGLDSTAHSAWLPEVGYLIANLPPRMRVAITTHDALPCLPIDPASRVLHSVTPSQLLADPDEAATIALSFAPGLPMDVVEAIVAGAEGWISAIRAAARHCAANPTTDPGHWLVTQGGPDLLDPWLDRLPVELLDFLIDTACLRQLAAGLCDAVRDGQGSSAMLEALAVHGGYLDPCFDELPATPTPMPWWCRHPLVSATVARRAGLLDNSVRHQRAAAWFREQGVFDDAMHHLVSGGQFQEAGRYLSTVENAFFEEGRSDEAAAWYASLPPESWGQRGWHLVRVAWGQALASEMPAARTTLAELRAHLAASATDTAEHALLQAEAETLAAHLATSAGDTQVVIASTRKAIDLFMPESSANSQIIAPAMLVRALLWEGEVQEARRELSRVEYRPFPPGILRESLLASVQAQCLIDEGRITEAWTSARAAVAWLGSQRLEPAALSQFTLMTSLAAAELESGDAMAAHARLDDVICAVADRGLVGETAIALMWRARSEVALGQLGDALASITRARALLAQSAPTSRIRGRLDLTEAFVRHVGGDALRAERLVQSAPASEARTLMWARVTMHRHASGVRQALSTITAQAPRLAADKQVLLATAVLRRSRTLAEGYLARAADIAAPQGLRLALLGSPDDLIDLARSYGLRTSNDALLSLVEALAGPGGHEGRTPANAAPSAQAPLSAGELQLLTYLPRRDSNADIARQLGVSVNTVKTRLYRMYRKLGVDSRDAAIDAARQRGLLR